MTASPRDLHVVHTESSCGWGGQEIRVLSEAQRMIARGHRVTLVAPPEARIAQAAADYAVPLVGLPIARKNFQGFSALRNWLRQNNADVINTHSSTDSWLTALACATLRVAPPIVRTRHVSSPVGTNRSTRWLYTKACCHLVVTGEALRAQLHRDNGIALAHMTSVPTGIDLTRFHPGMPEDARQSLLLKQRPTVVILATLRNWKGHQYLLDAFAALPPALKSWQLLIVGDGPQEANLKRRVSELALQDDVHFAGYQRDVVPWLQAGEVFVLPSYGDEGVPQGIMQAMACGLPVISTPIGAIAEAVQDGVTGMLIAPKDANALGIALQTLLADSALRERMSDAGQARAQAHFGIDRMAETMEAIFLSAALESQRD